MGFKKQEIVSLWHRDIGVGLVQHEKRRNTNRRLTDKESLQEF